MKFRCRGIAALLALSLIADTASAQPASVADGPSLASGPILEAVAKLKPGQFLWMPQIAPAGPVLVWVNLSTQRAVVFRNGIPIGITTISSGKRGYETPTGIFTVLQKHVEHYSNRYDNAPMPFMQRLTWTGIALHGGSLPGYPASHGCVRLPIAFAKLLFGVTNVGLTVVVSKDRAVPRLAPVAQPFADGVDAAGAWRWDPAISSSGPVSLVVSTTDRVMRVLRGGLEMGRAPVEVPSGNRTPVAYFLHRLDPEGPHWLRLPLPGQEQVRGEGVSDSGQWLSLPAPFRAQLMAVLRPGATLIITSDTLSTTARPITLLEGGGRERLR